MSVDEFWWIPDEKHGKKVKNAIKKKQKQQKDAWKASSFSGSDLHQLDRHALFLTERGHFGLCEGDIQAMDGIYRVEGSKSAFILRRAGHGKEHVVVGKTSIFRPGEDALDAIQLGDTGVKELVLV